MKGLPVHDRIIATAFEPEQKTQGGIIIVQSEKDQHRDTAFAKVIAVGKGKQVDSGGKLPMETEVGDIIVFNERIPLKFPFNGIEYLVLRESDVLLRFKPDEFE